MKRSGPPQRRTPLSRGKGLARVSKKGRRRQAEWKAARAERLDRDNGCCRYPDCTAQATDVHHKAGRIGRAFTDQDLLISLCRPHHMHVHAHPAESYRLGFMVRRVS